MKPVTHCIFDLDGLLIDSERLYAESLQRVLDPFGYKLSYEIQLRCMGLHPTDIADLIIETYALPYTRDKFRKLHGDYATELLRHVPLMPGVERLVQHLHTHQIPMAIASNSAKESYEYKTLDHSKFFKLFHHIILGTDPAVIRRKPAPDIFIIAANRFAERPKPQSCLVFEDSLNGLQAALSANMQVVLVPDKRLSHQITTSATMRLQSLEQFQPQLFGLPSF